MSLRKLPTANAFIAIDLPGAPDAVGVVRLAKKVLQGGAWDLARANTYRFATFHRKTSGVSAGINALPDSRATAIEAFVTELGAQPSEQVVMVDAAFGVEPDELGALRGHDIRATATLAPDEAAGRVDALTALGAVSAAEAAAGSLDGRSVAISGIEANTARIVARLASERGATVMAVSTQGATVTGSFAGEALTEAWSTGGSEAMEALGSVGEAASILGADADILFVGTKAGAIGHLEAPAITAGTLVPFTPLPVTPRALAMLGRSGTTVLPDFVTMGGPVFAWWPPPDADDAAIDAAATDAVSTIIAEVLDHDEGPFLGACYRAEAFLSTWCDELPFGRPLPA